MTGDEVFELLEAVGIATDGHAEQPGWLVDCNGWKPERGRAVAAVYNGYLYHYQRSSGDASTALLAGDRLFAEGICRLAAINDLDAVRALAELIALSATLSSRGRAEELELRWREQLDAL